MTTDTCSSGSMTRRDLLRRGSAATVATLGVGASAHKLDRSPVGSAEAIAPVALAAGAAAVGGLAYLSGVYTGAEFFGGGRVKDSDFTGADALKQAIAEDALEMKSADERVMTSIQNNIANSQNVALAKGKAAIIEKMNAGESESAAKTAMNEAVDAYYATIEKNLFTHWNAQLAQVDSFHAELEAHSNTSPTGVLSHSGYDPNSSKSYARPSLNAVDVQLLDGSTLSVHQYRFSANGSYVTRIPNTDANTEYEDYYGVADPDGGTIQIISWVLYAKTYDSIIAERDAVHSSLSGFVTDVYAEYSAGDIPTEDLVDPITASTELSQNYDGYQTQAAHAAMLGIPTDAKNSLVLEVENPDTGETATVSADIYTKHTPTDSNGNEVGFQVGQRYTPSSWSEPIYIAYRHTKTNQDGEVVEESQDFEQLEVPFTVVEATNKDGKSIDSFKTESRQQQTADVTKIEEELAQIRDEQIRMQEEAQQQSGGGGLSLDQFSIAGIPGAVVVLGAGAAALLGISK